MKLVKKQLIREILKNKVFLALMMLLSAFTSFMYFFVRFSIDENLAWLNNMSVFSAEQALYLNGLISNTILVRNVFIIFTALTGFVFGMFYYHFFQSAGKQLGCLKALGFKEEALILLFIKVSACISLAGAAIGLCAGYFASDILILSNQQSYLVNGIVKGISPASAAIGLLVPGAVFCVITFIMYGMIRGKEAGELLAGTGLKSDITIAFRLADKVSKWFPKKERLSVRLALRNPVAMLLILTSVMTLSTMFILAYSLNISSEKVFEIQTLGHHYLYEAYYDEPQHKMRNDSDHYIAASGVLTYKGGFIDWTLAGGDGRKEIVELLDADGNNIAYPDYGELVISSQLEELYGIRLGDHITIRAGEKEHPVQVSGVAYNAKQGWAYVSKKELCEMLSFSPDAYTVIFSMEKITGGGTVITREEKIDALRRGMVSNRVSAVINQVIGCVIGCMLLFLALFLNFQSSTRDIFILQLLGYQKKEIGGLLIDIYKPILLITFMLTLLPAMWLTKYILRTLSIQIGDYIMFQTNAFILAGIFVLLYIIYFVTYASAFSCLFRSHSIHSSNVSGV